MDITLIDQVLQGFALRVIGFIAILQPVGAATAGSLTVLGIVMLGTSLAVGGSFLPQLVRFTGAAACTFWAILYWDEILMGAVAASHNILSLFLPSYAGPSTLFTAAATASNRVLAEPAAWSFSISGTVGAFAQMVLIAISALAITVGLSFPGILSVMAELSLVLGGAVAPLVLPALCFPLTQPMGFAVITWLVSASLRVIVLGLIGAIFADVIQAAIDLPGPDQTLTFSGTMGLLLVSCFAVIAGLAGNNIAGALVGSGVGVLGWSSVTNASGLVTSAVSNTANAAVGAASAGAAGIRAGGGAAGSFVGGTARAAAKITSGSQGSAFGP